MLKGPETQIDFNNKGQEIVSESKRLNPNIHPDSDVARSIGERNVRNNMDFIVSELIPKNVIPIIKFIHAIATPFLKETTDPRNKYATTYLGGSTRSVGHNVIVGEAIPPTGDVVSELFEEFGPILGNLLTKAESYDDFKYIAAFAYLELLTIHPFPNGNGRTCRLLTEVIMAYGKKKTESIWKVPQFSRNDRKLEKISVLITKWQGRMHFYDNREPPFYSFMRNPSRYGLDFKDTILRHWESIEDGGIESIRAMYIVNDVKNEFLR